MIGSPNEFDKVRTKEEKKSKNIKNTFLKQKDTSF